MYLAYDLTRIATEAFQQEGVQKNDCKKIGQLEMAAVRKLPGKFRGQLHAFAGEGDHFVSMRVRCEQIPKLQLSRPRLVSILLAVRKFVATCCARECRLFGLYVTKGY
jgi:hypothetical protein